MENRLIPDVRNIDREALSDYLLVIAGDIEDVFIATGATPDKDYTRLDLIKMAVEIHKSSMTSTLSDTIKETNKTLETIEYNTRYLSDLENIYSNIGDILDAIKEKVTRNARKIS